MKRENRLKKQDDIEFYIEKVGEEYAGYFLLASAVLKKAVDDYIVAICIDDRKTKRRIEKFFMSDYGQALSLNHGGSIIREAREQAEKQMQQKRDTTTQRKT